MKIEKFEDLDIWQEAREFSRQIFQITNTGLFSKDFQFRNQIRSSSGSIMDNIAEGFERSGRKEFIQFLSIAKGSCGETKSQLYRASDAEYINKETCTDLISMTNTIAKKIDRLIQYLKKSNYSGAKF